MVMRSSLMLMSTRKMELLLSEQGVGNSRRCCDWGSKHLADEAEPMPYPPDESVGNATHLCFLTLRSCVCSTAL